MADERGTERKRRMEERKAREGKGGKCKVGRDCAVLKIPSNCPGTGPSLTLTQMDARPLDVEN